MKTIVVVGASRGIGKELVRYFAADKDHTVIALARNEAGLAEFSTFENVRYQTLDLASNNIKEKILNILTEMPAIDILINNAGKLVNKPFLELNENDFAESYQVNILGVMQTVQALVPKMLQHGGHIVNISSMGGFQGSVKFAGLSAYSSSKAALVSFTELFAEEFKETKIRMNCLCLGAVQTEMLAEAFPGYQAPLSAQEMASYIGDFALNAHRFMNGKIIPVSLSTP